MKLNKATYLSIFFLFCFLASFSVNAYQTLNVKESKTCALNHRLHLYSQKQDNASANAELLFEENENEHDVDFELAAFIIPYFVAYFYNSEFLPKQFSTKPLVEKYTNPIYLSVCNFRI